MRLIIPIVLLLSSLHAADTLYKQGKKLYFAKGCNGCHGIDAKGIAAYPGLAYRPKPFLTYKLNLYRSKHADTQQAQMMIPFAMKLTNADINALTTYLSEFKEDKKSSTHSYSIRGDGGS